MAGALLEELCPKLSEVARKGGWAILKEERSTSFDNAMVELECGELSARVIRDRGAVSIELAQIENDNWFDIEIILAFIGEVVPSGDLDALSELFAKNFEKISVLMTRNADQLDVFEKQRSSEFINRIFPNE